MSTEPTSEATESLIEFTTIPPYGSYLNLKGIVHHEDAGTMRVVVYIRVHGGWWTKPYWDSPTTPVSAEGVFSVNITTGGSDEQATEIATFLVSGEYYPPGLRGDPALPADLFEKALAHVMLTRSP